MRAHRRRHVPRLMMVVLAALLAGSAGLVGTGAAQAGTGAASRTWAGATGGTRVAAGQPVTARAPAVSGDLAVTGSGDLTGFHLYLSSGHDGWRWRPLATIQPGGQEDQRWIGQECLTGDGRTVVAVIAPWSASNSEAGMDSGGLAYAVSVRTGVVRPLAAGVSLAYFTPGCGLGSQVALTSYLGPQQRPTRISVLDAETGAVVHAVTTGGEITSAVPVDGQIIAAEGTRLVRVSGGTSTVLASFPGQVSGVHPAASGGVALVAQTAHGRAGIWSWKGGPDGHEVGTGPAAAVRLFGGRDGRNLAAGVTSLAAGSGLRRLPGRADVVGASLQGGLVLVERQGAQHTAAAASGRAIAEVTGGAARPLDTDLPRPATRRVQSVPARSVAAAATPTVAVRPAAATARTAPARRAVLTAASAASAANAVTGTTQCAVARNDIYKQAWQPTSAQVRWAVNQAVQGDLSSPYPDADRPPGSQVYSTTDAAGDTLTPAFASQDFPLLAGAPHVPPLVMYGILAQESNWNQASWHAVPGRAGNPLVANYYGDDASADSIDYSKADCGYGIAQVTTGMTQADWTGSDTAQIAPPSAQQLRVAVDYATNIAAGVQLLQAKWMDLHTLGLTMNNDDPTKIENWYAAIWAYNTGVHMSPADGGEGLGWLNNPANPIYPSPRHAFLHDGVTETYGDASTPNLWPYQERVFGWMDVPQLDLNGNPEYNGTFDWANDTGQFLFAAPDSTFCSVADNSCDSSVIGTKSGGAQADPCPDEDSSCWWDLPATWANCPAQCVTDTPANTPSGQTDYPAAGAQEPPAQPLSATCNLGSNTPVTTSGGSLIAGTVLVDDEMLTDQNPNQNTPNLMGCGGADAPLEPPASASASFTLTDSAGASIDADTDPSDIAAIDLHQLGAGLGGHLFFTHTIPASQSAQSEVQGTWAATLPASTTVGTVYQIYAFVPDLAAGAGYAPYEITTGGEPSGSGYGPPGARQATLYRVINQASYSNQWVSLGYYLCGGPDTAVAPAEKAGPANCTMDVSLSNVTPADDPTQGSDIAYDAVAFVPAPLGRNVIIGDSYSSGEGAPSGGFDDGTNVPDSVPTDSASNGNLCHRSPGAYGRLWDPKAIQLACSGADMWDVAGVQYWLDQAGNGVPINNGVVYYQPPSGSSISPAPTSTTSADNWIPDGPTPDDATRPNPSLGGSGYYGEPTFQTDLVRALKPKRVILTIGGNDAGFPYVVHNCINAPGSINQPCQPLYQIAGSTTDKLDNLITSLTTPLKATFAAVVNAAGSAAKVYVVTYPNIFIHYADQAANTTDCTLIDNSDRQWLISKTSELDSAITTAAGAAGINTTTNVVNQEATFAGHEECSAPYNGNATDVVPPNVLAGASPPLPVLDTYFHPDTAGYQALEAKLASQTGSP